MRYAVYAIPGLGGDPGSAAVRDAVEDWYARPEARDITVDARRYGCHATLKAPFRLRDGPVESDLVAAVENFARAHAPVVLPQLRLARIDGFFVLVPEPQPAAVDRIAAGLVMSLDGFRAALTPAEIARRAPERLTPRQRDLLDMWGYPFVLEEFRFHITLTDRLPDPEAEAVEPELREALRGVLGTDAVLDAVAVVIEPEPGAAFEILSAHPLTARPTDGDPGDPAHA